ncbi:MAG: Sec-independent protein translocase protein TatB [Rhodospirillaceae bacterium]
MFDLGWWEFAIVGVIMILVLGPKELPHAMRSIARFMRKARRLASEFQGHMDDLIREADLDDVKKTVRSIQNQNVNTLITDAVDPSGELKKEIDGTIADAKREMGDIKSQAGVSPSDTKPTSSDPVPGQENPALTDSPSSNETSSNAEPISGPVDPGVEPLSPAKSVSSNV